MEVDELLYSLIPLILIIVFSWLFSFLGSRARKRLEEEKGSPSGDTEDEFMKLFSDDEEDQWEESDAVWREEDEELPRTADSVQSPRLSDAGAPVVTPDPIKPKWWGA